MLELCLEFLHEVCKNAYVPVDNNYTLMTMVKFDDHWVFQIYRAEDHMDLADRLVECQYELTDRLAFYLCQRKPGKRKWIRSFFTELLESENFKNILCSLIVKFCDYFSDHRTGIHFKIPEMADRYLF